MSFYAPAFRKVQSEYTAAYSKHGGGKLKRFGFGYIPILAIVLMLMLAVGSVTNRAATVFSETRAAESRHCFVIDAGHGGEDGGATSCTGILESTFNLDIALRLDALMNLLGYPTEMIRKTDTAIHTQGESIAARKASDLKERVRIANTTQNAILISIHQNYFPESQYSGAQVFYAKTVGSDAIAKVLQTAFREKLNLGSKRREKPASGIYLMDHVACPGILIECGFLSNPEEEAKLRSPEYQKLFCCVIATTVSNQFSS